MVARAFVWLSQGGGAWSLASNWDDTTDGQDPSLYVPGAQDSVFIGGPTGTGNETITGAGLAASAAFTGNTTLAGQFGFGLLSLGADGSGGLLGIAPSAIVQAGTATLATGSIVAGGLGSQLLVAGTLTLGTGQNGIGSASCTLDATNGGDIQAAGLSLDASAAHIYVDPTSIVEIGTAGGAQAGRFTIDSSIRVAGFGDADGYGLVTNNGTLAASGGLLLVGAVSGAGTLEIDAGSVLDLNGVCGPGEAIVFAGANGTLAIAAEHDAPAGVVTGFVPGCSIDFLGSPISSAIYATTGSNMGLLTLTYGSQIAATVILAGNYAQDVFLTAGDGAGGTLVTVAPGGGGGGSLSGGTAGPDVYSWIAPGSGRWNVAANWANSTTGKSPAAVAPGLNNLVSIAAPTTGFSVIAGPGDAATLGITGDLALTGAFAVGALTAGTASGTAAMLDLLPGTTLATSSTIIADGAISLSGAGCALSISGTLVLGGGALGVGLPTATLSVAAGARVRAGSLVMGGGSGDWITTDPTATVEIGTAGGAAAGAFTVDAGATVTGNGSINPYGSIVNFGTITASGGALTLGAVTGLGALAVNGGGTLDLVSRTAEAITMTGVGATLALSSELVTPTGVITGLVPGDVIDIQGDQIDAASFARDPSGNSGTLTLTYGTTPVATLKLVGGFVNQHFLTAPDGLGGTDILVSTYGGGGGGGGQGNTDLLAWAQPVSGSWNNAKNWIDLTTGLVSKTAPGIQNLVQIAGPSGASFQTVGGPGLCGSLSFTGNTLLAAGFTATSLQIGAPVAGVLASGFIELNSGSTLAVTQANLASGNLLVSGTAASCTVLGTMTLGGAGASVADASVGTHGTIQMGGLVLAQGSMETDSSGSIEIGTLASAAAGAITLDTGIVVTGTGSLNAPGRIVDNGALGANGGTLIVGSVAGTGMLSIGTESTLVLDGTELCPISFTGGGGTLFLEGTAEVPAGTIAGFGAGDSIVVGSSLVSGLVWSPGAGNVGTLTMTYGGQVAGQLVLSGDYSGDTFSVQPTDAGAEITVQPWNGNGPSPGTVTPDVYVWTGQLDTEWNKAANWTDVTNGATPAAIAPGQHNLVTIQGPVQGYQQVVGPADAAVLTLLGDVALGAQYSVGALDVGEAGDPGLVAFAAGASLEASLGVVAGGIAAGGGTVAIDGLLTLGLAGVANADGVLIATSGSSVTAGGITLKTAASAILTDAFSSVEIGGTGHAVLGAVSIDAGGVLQGEGAVNLSGNIVDNGLILAEGGTLALGAVSGSGTLLIGVGANLVLDGTSGAGLTIDFTAAGTLTLADGMAAAAIADFGTSDQILLSTSGATSADYAASGPGIGQLTLYAGDQVLTRLTLLGVQAGAVFNVSAAPGGGTILTTTPGQTGGNGGGNMGNPPLTGPVNPATFIASLPDYAQYWLGQAIGEGGNNLLTPYVWDSLDGTDFGPAVPIYANIGVVTDPVSGSLITMPEGYKGLIVEGSANVGIADFNVGGTGSTLVGNLGNDTIVGANGDTLVGGLGAQTVFATNATVTIQGGGNDIYATGIGNVTIITSDQRSLVALGGAQNYVTSYGNDTIACLGGGTTNDTVDARLSDNTPVIFGPSSGTLLVEGGNAPVTVVGTAGQIFVDGGAGGTSYDPNVLWCTSGFSSYLAGSGASAVVGGSGDLQVGSPDLQTQMGEGPVTVYGGTGLTQIWGAAGGSVFLVGFGASTVDAAAGNSVYVTGSAAVSVGGSGSGIFVWGASSTANDTLQSGSGYETMVGGSGSDLFHIGNGQGLFEGMGGADTFAFTNGTSGGAATIYDFNTAIDHIGLQGYAGGAAAVLATETVSGGNTFLTLQDGTHLTLLGVSNLTASAFNIS